jgi:DnaJ-class molecular chaperone
MMVNKSAGSDVQLEQVTCSFCQGKGTDPFDIMSALSTCCVCGGTGTVRVSSPYTACAHCQGTGAIKTLTCTVCAGKGFIPLGKQPSETCPYCNGSGDDGSNPYLSCLRCCGRGFIESTHKTQAKERKK